MPLDLAFQRRESGHGWPRWRIPVFALQNDIERIAAMKGCSHGKTFAEPCIECKLVSAREGLAWAQQGVERYSKLIEELESTLGLAEARESSEIDRMRRKMTEIHDISQDQNMAAWEKLDNIAATASSALGIWHQREAPAEEHNEVNDFYARGEHMPGVTR
jgi:hypothetical protein